jgi:MFS family permease
MTKYEPASPKKYLLIQKGVMSGLIGAGNQFGREFHRPDTKLQGLIVSIYDVRQFLANCQALNSNQLQIGCAAGCLIACIFGERFGRKKMIIAGGSTMIVGTIILGSSNTLAQLLVGRIVTGIGNGFNSKSFQLSYETA